MKLCSRSWAERGLLLAAALGVPAAAQTYDLPPAGFGTLRQDQVAVRIAAPDLQVRVLPLDERVIRLLAADTYRSLRQLVQSRAGDMAAAARAAGHDSVVAFVVTYFAIQPQVRFNADQLYISSQSAFFRPIGIVPLTPRWSEYQLDQRQQASAIYLFEPGIAVLRPFTVSYGERSSDAWTGSLRTLHGEHARVLARAARQSRP
ncbi:MAG: hypothetical protein HY705_02745, partial [Gemmatimonadetes bacterium]|nr:hypothetical protein [Gemmatimonadota bacterium]